MFNSAVHTLCNGRTDFTQFSFRKLEDWLAPAYLIYTGKHVMVSPDGQAALVEKHVGRV